VFSCDLSCLFVTSGNSRPVVLHIGLGAGIATGHGLDDRGVGVPSPGRVKKFHFSNRPGWFWGPPNLLYNGYKGLFPGGKADHSPQSCAEVKKLWMYTTTPPFMVLPILRCPLQCVCLILLWVYVSTWEFYPFTERWWVLYFRNILVNWINLHHLGPCIQLYRSLNNSSTLIFNKLRVRAAHTC
jgi:hypothetical protein